MRNIPSVETSESQPKRQRLRREARRNHILNEAIQYFSEVGFDGGTRELADRLGVKQPLLYRYFSSKEDLIREVYETVFVGRWKQEWNDLISNRDIPLRDRLIQFYTGYIQVQFKPEWIRIFLFSGLKGLEINRHYVTFMEEHVLKKICGEIRCSCGLPPADIIPIQPRELATFWIFHSGVFYYGMRREVYGVPVHVGEDEFTELSVDGLLSTLPKLMRQVLANCPIPDKPPE
jgi:AcrR family transcriptional regulator